MNKTTLTLVAAMLLGGCASSSQPAPGDTLANRSFVLTSVDGHAVTAPQGMKPGINFGEDMRVTGVMCNRFFGQGKLETGVLTVPHMASTRMLCSNPELNKWEMAIVNMLTAGARVKLTENTLTLEGAGHSLVYLAQ